MATSLVNSGTKTLSAEVDDDGHFTATVSYLVRCDVTDGPVAILETFGLPQFGDFYQFRGESHPWAFCRPGAKVSIHRTEGDGPAKLYTVEKTFSTRPLKRCGEERFENPLLEPQKVSGSFLRATLEATSDRFGAPIVNSAFERVRGKEVEFEVFHPEVKVEQNVADLELPLLTRANNTVNDAALWGFPRRCVRCTVTGFEQKFHGLCNVYYTRSLLFTAMSRKDPQTGFYASGWDREILDEGTKALNGEWNFSTGNYDLLDIGGSPPSRYNPAHFIRVKDRQGENTKVVLNGEGVPIDTNVMGAVTDATNSTPVIVTTATPHGLSSADVVGVSQVSGNTGANGLFYIEVLSPTSFSLHVGLDAEESADAEGTGDYEGGGFWFAVGAAGPGRIHVEFHDEFNMALLGIPLDLNFVL